MIETVTWKIVGYRPLMLNNPAAAIGKTDAKKGRRGVGSELSPHEEATAKLYSDNGRLYVPTDQFWKAMVLACPGVTVPVGSKKRIAASSIVPPNVEPIDEEMWLCDPETLDKKIPRALGAKDWIVDTRMAQNPKVGGVIVSRPKFRIWGGLLIMNVERDVIPEEADTILTDILNIAGTRGVGSGRLRKKMSEWFGLRMGKFKATLIP